MPKKISAVKILCSVFWLAGREEPSPNHVWLAGSGKCALSLFFFFIAPRFFTPSYVGNHWLPGNIYRT